jgi:hypothetical protein
MGIKIKSNNKLTVSPILLIDNFGLSHYTSYLAGDFQITERLFFMDYLARIFLLLTWIMEQMWNTIHIMQSYQKGNP